MSWNPQVSGGYLHPGVFGYHSSHDMPYHNMHHCYLPQGPWGFIQGPMSPLVGCTNTQHALRQDPMVTPASGVGTEQDIITSQWASDQIVPAKMFSLHGPSFPGCDTIADMFRPRFLLYGNHPDLRSVETELHFANQSPRVDHLDIVKIWKGLSSDKAEELLFWEISFKEALEELLRNQLEFLRHDLVDSGNIYLQAGLDASDPPMCDRFHYLPISLFDIVSSMVLYSKQHHRPYRWFASIGNIYKVVAQLVRTHDCFLQHYIGSGCPNTVGGLKVGVRLWQPQANMESFPGQPSESVVEMSWNPGYLSFEQLDASPQEGQEFCLTPRYHPPFSLGTVSSKASSQFSIIYATSVSWLQWNPQLAAFTGIMPFFSDMQGRRGRSISNLKQHEFRSYTLPMIVKASVTEYFDSSVRFEQTVRARVTISVNYWRSLERDICSESCCGSQVIDKIDLMNRRPQPMPGANCPLNHQLVRKTQNYLYSCLEGELCGEQPGFNPQPPSCDRQRTQNRTSYGERQDEALFQFEFLGERHFSRASTYFDYPSSFGERLPGRGDDRSPGSLNTGSDIQMCKNAHWPDNCGSARRDSKFEVEAMSIRDDGPSPSRAADMDQKMRFMPGGSLAPPEPVNNLQNLSAGSGAFLRKPKPQLFQPISDDYAVGLEGKNFPWKSPRRGMKLSLRPKVSRRLRQHKSQLRSKLSTMKSDTWHARGPGSLCCQDVFRRFKVGSLNNSALSGPMASILPVGSTGIGWLAPPSHNIAVDLPLQDEESEADVSWTASPSQSESSDPSGESLTADDDYNMIRNQESMSSHVTNAVELLTPAFASDSDSVQMFHFQDEHSSLGNDRDDIFVTLSSNMSAANWSAEDGARDGRYIPERSPGQGQCDNNQDSDDENDSNAGMPLPFADEQQGAFL